MICVLFMMMVPSHGVKANTVAYAVPFSDNVPVYDNRTGELVQIATMKLNQPLVIHADYGANWWQVKLGNGYGYINKKDVYRSTTWVTNNVNKGLVNTNTAVTTHVDTKVYENTVGSSLVEIGTIKKGYRYPIIADYGVKWWQIDFGGRIGYIHKKDVGLDTGVPILMYHHILTPEQKANSQFAKAGTTITTNEFNTQMQYLKDQGFTTLSLNDLEKYLNKSINIPAKSIVITFDDGIVSTREYAYPILKSHGFVAEQFIITGRIGENKTFDWKTLQFFSQEDMDNMTDVFNYGNHTHALHNAVKGVSDVVSKPDSTVYSDIQTAKNILGTNHFAYPFGQYNSSTINTLKQLGFKTAVTTKSGKVKLGEDKLQLERINIYPGMTLTEFSRLVSQ